MDDRKRLLIFFIVCFCVLGVLSFFLIKTLLSPLILGIIFSYLFYPLYKRIYNKVKSRHLSAIISCTLFILIISIPLIFAANVLAIEMLGITTAIADLSPENFLYDYECEDKSFCGFITRLTSNSIIKSNLADLLSEITASMRNYFGTLLFRIPFFIFDSFLIIFIMYFLLLDGTKMVDKIKRVIPVANHHKDVFFTKINRVFRGILYGTLLIAVMQGVLALIGFLLFGVKYAILWGILTVLAALLPFVGAGAVWFPASVYLFVTAIRTPGYDGLGSAIGLFLWGAIIVSTSDNFVRPKLVSAQTNIHPLLVLIGVFGGLALFSTPGVIIGPLIMGIVLTTLEMYEMEKNFLFSNSTPSYYKNLQKQEEKKNHAQSHEEQKAETEKEKKK